MSLSRRKFIGVIGGGTIVAASAGVGVFISTRTPTKALEPWEQAGTYDEPRRKALSYAILAPNPHNRQPWLVDLQQKDKIILYVDTERMLPETDPYNRQVTIGLGCFLEVLKIAAAEQGYRTSSDDFPDGFDNTRLDKRPVTVISFVKDSMVQKDPLFSQILNRRSLKEPFDTTRKVTDDVLRSLTDSVGDGVITGASNKLETVNQIRKITHDAMAIEIKTPRTYQESVDLFRIGKAEINANPDGIDFSGAMFESLAKVGYFTREAALDSKSSAYHQGIDAVMASIDTAMGYIWLTTKTNTRLDQLNAGREWVRINLKTTKNGIGLHPISQALQEYSEVNDSFVAIHKLLKADGGTVQMLGRLGYADKVPPSPRWPLAAKILKS